MRGTIVNRYGKNIEVDIIEVECASLGYRCLIGKREYEGGKVHLQIFSPDKHEQLPSTVNRYNISRVVTEGETSDLPAITVSGEDDSAHQAA